ncbi:DUF4386 domain-containing protein [Arthrobacter livingstonensis]|nr:DUF4386 domain-containing protein [Arthrobacter livingstonensis]
MTITDHTTATGRAPMSSSRKTSLVAGALYLLTFVSIPTLALYRPVAETNFITGAGPDAPIIIGGILEIIVALAGIGTAVALFPVIKRQNEGLALGVVAARVFEAAAMFAGVVCLLALVTLRQAGGGAGSLATGQALVSMHNWFFMAQNLMPAANALMLGTLMYKSRLVPRALPIMGFIGAPLLIVSTFATILGVNDQISAWSGLSALPVAAWEFSLGAWLAFKGFKPSPITAEMDSARGAGRGASA